MIPNSELKDRALMALDGKWGLAIAGYLIYNIILIALQSIPVIGNLTGLLVGGPFLLGITWFSLALARNEELKIELIFEGFKDFTRSLGTYLLMLLYIVLWSLLLIVPGIIKAISYSQTFYILAEDNTISDNAAIEKSMAMMEGYKTQYFLLMLSFLGWALLCLLTLGIGFLWLAPYMNVTLANFYLELKEEYTAVEIA